jgi:hypothetical protein
MLPTASSGPFDSCSVGKALGCASVGGVAVNAGNGANLEMDGTLLFKM